MTRRRVFWALTALWLLFVWGHSLLPASVSKEESGHWLALLQNWMPWLTDYLIRKAAHFTEYAVLGALLFGAAGVRKTRHAAAAALCADAAGFLAAAWCVRLLWGAD